MLFLGGDIQCCFYYFERFSRREMRKGKLKNLDVVPKEILTVYTCKPLTPKLY
jgi:hypothetical protein